MTYVVPGRSGASGSRNTVTPSRRGLHRPGTLGPVNRTDVKGDVFLQLTSHGPVEGHGNDSIERRTRTLWKTTPGMGVNTIPKRVGGNRTEFGLGDRSGSGTVLRPAPILHAAATTASSTGRAYAPQDQGRPESRPDADPNKGVRSASDTACATPTSEERDSVVVARADVHDVANVRHDHHAVAPVAVRDHSPDQPDDSSQRSARQRNSTFAFSV